jgi:hypothetical protein
MFFGLVNFTTNVYRTLNNDEWAFYSHRDYQLKHLATV